MEVTELPMVSISRTGSSGARVVMQLLQASVAL